MKVMSVALARVIWFLDTNELNPGGKDFFTHLFPWLLEDYKFKTCPKPGEDFSQGMKFVNGEFVKEDGTVLVLNVTMFSDGISADTFSSTTDSEDFLGTALSQLPELGFAYDQEMIRRKAYLSQLNVKCAGSLQSLNPGLTEFARLLSSATGGTAFDVAAMELWPDQAATVKPTNFSFQRKLGEPLNSDRYWSQAAVPTDKHVELLEQLEVLLSASPR
jgi:hypothetical protein